MIQSILNKKAKKITHVDATVNLVILGGSFQITFGEGDPDRVDTIIFKNLSSLFKLKPTKVSGNGAGILAFKQMLRS